MATPDRPAAATAAVGLGWPAEPLPAPTPASAGSSGLGWPGGVIDLPDLAESADARVGEQQ